MVKVSKAKKADAQAAALQAKAGKEGGKKQSAAAGAGGAKGPASRHPFLIASKGIASVREALIAHFKDVLVPSAAFKATFGDQSWEDVEATVRADIERFGLDAASDIVREPDGSATYTGRIFGLYTEVLMQPGEAPAVFVELD